MMIIIVFLSQIECHLIERIGNCLEDLICGLKRDVFLMNAGVTWVQLFGFVPVVKNS